MRIIGGKFKGLRLASVGRGDKDAHLRPTTDRVRESIFNLLQNGGYDDPIEGATVLDLFAGTGALGFEALSRGARSVTFVDDGVVSRSLVHKNATLCRTNDEILFVKCNATRLGQPKSKPYDLVFLDPPYGKELGQKALQSTRQNGWLKQDALIVWEESTEQVAPEGFKLIDRRRYGDTWVHILTYEG